MVGATASALFHTGTVPFLIGDTRASADFVSGYLPRETPDLSAYRFFSGKFTRREGLTEISGVWAYTPGQRAGDGCLKEEAQPYALRLLRAPDLCVMITQGVATRRYT